MTGQFFISLLNPGIGLLFAAAFFLLWLNRRDQAYVAYAAIAYLCSALAFLIQDVGPVLPFELQRIPSNLGFLATGAFFAAAIIRRYGLPVPWRAMAVTGALSMAAFLWFLLGHPSIAARIYAISLGAGIIAAMVVRALWPIEKPHLIDRVLFWVAALSAINLIVRPLVILWLGGGFDNYNGFQQSVYWTTVQFSQAMVSVLAAISLMVAVAIDLLAELRAEAESDPLSGLLNRRGFEAAAGAALRRCHDEARAAALLIADLDRFKAVNDTHGHAVGDAIIAAFGAHVRRIGPADMVAGRIGGEEFALLPPRRGDRGGAAAGRGSPHRARPRVRRADSRRAHPDRQHRPRRGGRGRRAAQINARGRPGTLRGEARRPRPRPRLHRALRHRLIARRRERAQIPKRSVARTLRGSP